MRKLTIRFVKRKETYYIQRYKWFRWRNIGYYQGSCAGGEVWVEYYAKTKEELLDKVMKHYKTCLEFVEITEHATILKY